MIEFLRFIWHAVQFGFWTAVVLLGLFVVLYVAIATWAHTERERTAERKRSAAPSPPIPSPPAPEISSAGPPGMQPDSHDEDYPSTEHLEVLGRNLRLPVWVEYCDRHGELTDRRVALHEILGVDLRGATHLVGRCSMRRAERTFRISRIVRLIDLTSGEEVYDIEDWALMAALDAPLDDSD